MIFTRTASIAPTTFDFPEHLPVGLQWPSLRGLLHADESSNFNSFKLNQGYSKYSIALCVFQTIFILWQTFHMEIQHSAPLVLKLIYIVRLLTIFPLWLYFYLFKQYVKSDVLSKVGKHIMFIGNMNIFLHALHSGGLLLVWTMTHHDCNTHHGCLEEYPKHTIPLSMFIEATIWSIAMSVFYSSHHISVCFASILASYVMVLTAAVILQIEHQDFLAVLFMGLAMFFILFIYEASLYVVYTSFSKFEMVLRENIALENEESLLKLQTEEMRHMIGTSWHPVGIRTTSQ